MARCGNGKITGPEGFFDPPGPGEVFLYYGRQQRDNDVLTEENADASFVRELGLRAFGASITRLGDIDGDGLDDVLIGTGGFLMQGIYPCDEFNNVFDHIPFAYILYGANNRMTGRQDVDSAAVPLWESEDAPLGAPTNGVKGFALGDINNDGLHDFGVIRNDNDALMLGDPDPNELAVMLPFVGVYLIQEEKLPVDAGKMAVLELMDVAKSLMPFQINGVNRHYSMVGGDFNGQVPPDILFSIPMANCPVDVYDCASSNMMLSGSPEWETSPGWGALPLDGVLDTQTLAQCKTLGDFNSDGIDDALFLVKQATETDTQLVGPYVFAKVLYGSLD